MHTMIPAPTRVIRIEPMTETAAQRIKRRRRNQTIYEIANGFAAITLIVLIGAICVMLKTS